MQRPKVIFFDAVGTLFGVKGSVGKVYSEMAQRFGVQVSDSTLDQAFLRSFQQPHRRYFQGHQRDSRVNLSGGISLRCVFNKQAS